MNFHRDRSFWFWMLVLDVVFAPVLWLIYGVVFGLSTWWADLRYSWGYWWRGV